MIETIISSHKKSDEYSFRYHYGYIDEYNYMYETSYPARLPVFSGYKVGL